MRGGGSAFCSVARRGPPGPARLHGPPRGCRARLLGVHWAAEGPRAGLAQGTASFRLEPCWHFGLGPDGNSLLLPGLGGHSKPLPRYSTWLCKEEPRGPAGSSSPLPPYWAHGFRPGAAAHRAAHPVTPQSLGSQQPTHIWGEAGTLRYPPPLTSPKPPPGHGHALPCAGHAWAGMVPGWHLGPQQAALWPLPWGLPAGTAHITPAERPPYLPRPPGDLRCWWQS